MENIIEDIIITKRPKFETEELKRFEKRMNEIEWDNKKGEGVLSEKEIEKLSKKILDVEEK